MYAVATPISGQIERFESERTGLKHTAVGTAGNTAGMSSNRRGGLES
jgi:hypothetical protein